MEKYTEKRTKKRITASVPLRYKELHGKTYLARGTLLKNISESGVRFSADKFIPLSAHLVLEINLPHTVQAVKTIAKVAWIKKLPAGKYYDIGNHFLAMSDRDEKFIASFVKAF